MLALLLLFGMQTTPTVATACQSMPWNSSTQWFTKAGHVPCAYMRLNRMTNQWDAFLGNQITTVTQSFPTRPAAEAWVAAQPYTN